VLKAGSGSEHPGARDRVKVHYTGWTKDGGMFDSSVTRGVPAQFVLDRVIPGWSEGLQLMVRGEKRRFWIPAKLAYGDAPTRPGLPAGPLTFDIELLDISKVTAAVLGPTGPR
jgi:peptidylprolyl isomerase